MLQCWIRLIAWCLRFWKVSSMIHEKAFFVDIFKVLQARVFLSRSESFPLLSLWEIFLRSLSCYAIFRKLQDAQVFRNFFLLQNVFLQFSVFISFSYKNHILGRKIVTFHSLENNLGIIYFIAFNCPRFDELF